MGQQRGRDFRGGLTRVRSERGALAIQMVMLLPLAFSLLFLAVQGAVYYQGRTVAMSAAQEGARSAAGHEATNGDGRAAALAFADRAGGESVFDDARVTVDRDTDTGTVLVEVSGRTGSFVPGWNPEVSMSASRSIEEFTRPEERHSWNDEDNSDRPSW